jgi:hypothetical protein
MLNSFKLVAGSVLACSSAIAAPEPPATDATDSSGIVICYPAATADFDGDKVITSSDYLAFLMAWMKGSPLADVNHDGAVNSSDFFEFIAAFLSSPASPGTEQVASASAAAE